MVKPLISVIVPIYKVEKWVEKCVRSICSQDYPYLEIICVDDGSPDGSGAILDALAAQDNRIRVIHQQNQGLSAARNAALAVAQGEWVTGVDGDDALAPGTYAALLPYMVSEVDVIVYGTQKVDECGNALSAANEGYFRLPERGVYPVTPLMMDPVNVCFWNKLWRRRLIVEHDVRFPVGLLHEDEAFSRLFYPWAHSVAFVPSVAYLYAQRENSIMSLSCQNGRTTVFRNQLVVADWLQQQYQRLSYPVSSWSYFVSLLWQTRPADDAASCAERGRLAAIAARYVSPAADYRVRYLLHERNPRTLWCRYAPGYVDYFLAGVPVLRLCYDGRTGRLCGWETLWGKLRRRLKYLMGR